jgi:hypothetical protein
MPSAASSTPTMRANGSKMSPWVFLSTKGHRWDERNLRRSWYHCLDRSGIRKVRFHDLRHTFVSLLIQKGANPKYIQEQAGHSGIQVTMDTYGHLFPNQNREWINKLDEAGFVPASYPEAGKDKKGIEQRTDKPLDLQEELDGGGDPDRTGDPRLMSPLLCQLSYTATRLEDQQKNDRNNTRAEPNLSSRPTVTSGKT